MKNSQNIFKIISYIYIYNYNVNIWYKIPFSKVIYFKDYFEKYWRIFLFYRLSLI